MPSPVHVLLTRPRPQAERFAQTLNLAYRDRIRVVISPILTIRPTNSPVSLAGVAGVILSSENAARALAEVADISGLRAYCVGDRTARIATELGMQAISAQGTAADLITLVRNTHGMGELLHAHGAHVRGDIAANLNAHGLKTRSQVIYDQIETSLDEGALTLLRGEDPVICPLFSPRSALLLGKATEQARAPLALACLSAAVRAAWAGPEPVASALAERPDSGALCDILDGLITALST